MPLIEPPVIVALLDAKLFATTVPNKLTESSGEPIVIVSASALSVPILIVLPPAPVPTLIIFELAPVPRLTVPVVPESRVSAFEPVDAIVPFAAKVSPVPEVVMVSSDMTPDSAPPVVTLNPVDVKERLPLELPTATFPVPVVATFTSDAPDVPRFVVPLDDNVVNAPVDGVAKPIAVELIPVDVVVKLPDVIIKLFTPASIDEADNPDKVRAPEV